MAINKYISTKEAVRLTGLSTQDIYNLIHSECYTIKRYYCDKSNGSNGFYNNRIELRPLNPDYGIIVLQPDEAYKTIGIFKCVL